MRGRRGVTLLELMTVVIVVGILAAIAIPQFFTAQERIRGGEAMQQLGSIRSSQLRFRAWSLAMKNQDVYTTNPADLDFTTINTTDWGFTLASATAPAAGVTATATRTAAHGGAVGNTISINLETGVLCSAHAVYGLPNACGVVVVTPTT